MPPFVCEDIQRQHVLEWVQQREHVPQAERFTLSDWFLIMGIVLVAFTGYLNGFQF